MEEENNIDQKQLLQDLENGLYYGSEQQKIYLERTTGQYYKYNTNDLHYKSDEESTQSALEYRHVQTSINSDTYKLQKLLIPCVAAKALSLDYEKHLKKANESKEYNKDNFMENILIKTNQKSDFYGYQSGKRSLIFKDPQSGKYYRLKGCGNREKGQEIGFSLLDCESLVQGTVEIRGAHFEHTCKRELYMSEQIQKIMEKNGILVVNKPLGFWVYDQNFLQNIHDKNLQNQYPEVDKYCGIFENYGEKRVVTHLIQGLNIILICMSQRFENTIESQKILNLFDKDRIENGASFPSKTPVDFDMKTPEEIKQMGGILNMLKEQKFWKLEDRKKYVDLLQFYEQNQELQENNAYIKDQDWEYIFEICNIDNIYKDLYTNISQRLKDKSLKEVLNLISLIYARIGYEMGNVMRIMLENEINWGYYRDHHPYINHCNAHPNNLVIIDPKIGNKNITGTLDYDLAFFKKDFINLNLEENTYGKYDEALFDSFQDQSRVNLELALSGMEIYENFEFSTFDIQTFSQSVQNIFEIFHVGNRDTMLSHYINGFLKNQEGTQQLDLQRESINNIVKLGLILTSGQTC